MKTLIRSNVCHNVHIDASDVLNNGWHKGWRKEGSTSIAFYFKKKWWSSVTGRWKVSGPFINKETALNATLENSKESS